MRTVKSSVFPFLACLMAATIAQPARAGSADNWSGFYAGVNAGYGWAHISGRQIDIDSAIGSATAKGSLFGGQLGFDYQTSNWVWGLQLSLDKADVSGSHLFIRGSGPFDRVTYRIKSLTTLTGRAGYLVKPDTLIYLKAGSARTRTGHDDTDPAPSYSGLSYTGNSEVTRKGWIAGAGLERKFGQKVSSYLEYQYMAFGKQTTAIPYSDGMVARYSFKQNMSSLAIGVNYRF